MKMRSRGPIAISCIYFAFGFLWILFSDRLLGVITASAEAYAQLQTYKGWLYVVLTTLLLYALLRVYADRKSETMRQLRAHRESLKKSIHEKEVLLDEVHHRVKNNLQMIISLIPLSKEQEPAKSGAEIVDGIVARIHAIALVHEQVYKADSVERIESTLYLSALIESIRDFSAPVGVQIESNVQTCMFSVDEAIACGIVVNELISNALEHGFAGRDGGNISLSFAVEENRRILEVVDDGIGFATQGGTGSFGIDLVRAMCDRLDGYFTMESDDGGFRARLEFLAESG